MSYRVLILMVCMSAGTVMCQTSPPDSTNLLNRVLDWFTQDSKSPEKPRLIYYPTLAYSPETSVEFGLASSLLFHMRNDHLGNRLSEITAFGFITLRRQYGIWLDNAVYGHRNRWILLGRVRAQYLPLRYYGIGNGNHTGKHSVIEGTYVLMRQHYYRQVYGNWFVGIQGDYQQLSNVKFDNMPTPIEPIPVGAEGSRNVALGTGIIYDSRPNYLNTRNGAFAELSWLNYGKRYGGDYNMHALSAEVRFYKKMRKNEVIAFQAYINRIEGKEVPFNMLSQLGNESLMRGYYTGRFRDKQYSAAQTEYRWLPFAWSKRVGGAVFAGIGSVGDELRTLGPVRWVAGGGLRYLLFPKKDIFVRLDCGITREGLGFYIFTGEAF